MSCYFFKITFKTTSASTLPSYYFAKDVKMANNVVDIEDCRKVVAAYFLVKKKTFSIGNPPIFNDIYKKKIELRYLSPDQSLF